MSADLQDRPASEPIPAFIQRMLDNAAAQKKRAASATFLDWSGLDRACSFGVGADVKVAVTVRRGTSGVPEHDVVRLDRVWTLVDSGATLVHLGCPDKPPPVTFMAAARVWDAQGVRHDMVVIDRTGGSGALAETAVVDGKQVGKTLRTQVLRFAQKEEKARAKKAAAKLNRQDSAVSGVKPGNAIFASGVASHIMEDPTRRGIDEGRAALQWSYRTVSPEGNERIVAVSDPTFAADPLSRAATAGVSALGVDEWKRTKPSEKGANVWERDIQLVEGAPSSDAVRQSYTPSSVFAPVSRPPEPHELKPRPSDQREWTDTTGTAGTGLADNTLSLEVLAALKAELAPGQGVFSVQWTTESSDSAAEFLRVFGMPASQELLVNWLKAGLDDREALVLLADQAGFEQKEIGDLIKRDARTVRRILTAARKNLRNSVRSSELASLYLWR